MFGIFHSLLDIAQSRLGNVKEAHLYPSGLIVIEGKKSNGDKFRMTLDPNIHVDKEDGDG